MLHKLLSDLFASSIPLDKFNLLPKYDWGKHNVKNALEIMINYSWPSDRETKMEKEGMSIERVRPWIIAIDLCRVKSMPIDVAQIIAMSGRFNSVQDLSKSAPREIEKIVRMGAKNLHLELDLQEISFDRLLKNAKKTHSRLIWDWTDTGSFRSIVEANYVRNNTLELYTTWSLLRIIFTVLFSILLCLFSIQVCLFLIIASKQDAVLGMVNTFVLGLLLGCWVLIVFTTGYATGWFSSVYLKVKLASRKHLKMQFLSVLTRGADWALVVGAIVSPIFLGILALIVLVVLLYFPLFFDLIDTYELVIRVLFIFTVIFSLILLIPDMVLIRKDIPKNHLTHSIISRYFFLRIINILTSLLELSFAGVSLWLFIKLQQVIVRYSLAPYHSNPASAIMELSLSIPDWISIETQSVLKLIVWIFSFLIFTYFFIPYILLKDYKKAIYFVVLAVLAKFGEDAIFKITEVYFDIPSGSIFSVILFVGAIILNAAVFETIEDISDDEDFYATGKICLECSKLSQLDAKYCKYCGKSNFSKDFCIGQK